MGSVSFSRLFGKHDLGDFTGAVCAWDVLDPDLWYSEETSKQAVAVRVCNRCPIKDACLIKATEMEDGAHLRPYGVWGGATASERIAMDPDRYSTEADIWADVLWGYDLFEEDE